MGETKRTFFDYLGNSLFIVSNNHSILRDNHLINLNTLRYKRRIFKRAILRTYVTDSYSYKLKTKRTALGLEFQKIEVSAIRRVIGSPAETGLAGDGIFSRHHV